MFLNPFLKLLFLMTLPLSHSELHCNHAHLSVQQNQCMNAHPECPQEVCYTDCPCACFVASSTSPCDCSQAICSC